MRTRRLCHSPTHCGPRWLLHTEFYVKRWGDKGKTWPAQLQHHCKTCQRIHTRAVKAKQRGKEPYKQRAPRLSHEELKRRKRLRYHEQKKDKEWLKNRRQLAAELATIKRRDAGVPPRKFKSKRTGTSVVVNAEPLLRWLEPFMEENAKITKRLDDHVNDATRDVMGGKAVETIFTPNQWRILKAAKQRGNIYDTTADAILTHLGYPHMLEVLYGEAIDQKVQAKSAS